MSVESVPDDWGFSAKHNGVVVNDGDFWLPDGRGDFRNCYTVRVSSIGIHYSKKLLGGGERDEIEENGSTYYRNWECERVHSEGVSITVIKHPLMERDSAGTDTSGYHCDKCGAYEPRGGNAMELGAHGCGGRWHWDEQSVSNSENSQANDLADGLRHAADAIDQMADALNGLSQPLGRSDYTVAKLDKVVQRIAAEALLFKRNGKDQSHE